MSPACLHPSHNPTVSCRLATAMACSPCTLGLALSLPEEYRPSPLTAWPTLWEGVRSLWRSISPTETPETTLLAFLTACWLKPVYQVLSTQMGPHPLKDLPL